MIILRNKEFSISSRTKSTIKGVGKGAIAGGIIGTTLGAAGTASQGSTGVKVGAILGGTLGAIGGGITGGRKGYMDAKKAEKQSESQKKLNQEIELIKRQIPQIEKLKKLDGEENFEEPSQTIYVLNSIELDGDFVDGIITLDYNYDGQADYIGYNLRTKTWYIMREDHDLRREPLSWSGVKKEIEKHLGRKIML